MSRKHKRPSLLFSDSFFFLRQGLATSLRLALNSRAPAIFAEELGPRACSTAPGFCYFLVLGIEPRVPYP